MTNTTNNEVFSARKHRVIGFEGVRVAYSFSIKDAEGCYRTTEDLWRLADRRRWNVVKIVEGKNKFMVFVAD